MFVEQKKKRNLKKYMISNFKRQVFKNTFTQYPNKISTWRTLHGSIIISFIRLMSHTGHGSNFFYACPYFIHVVQDAFCTGETISVKIWVFLAGFGGNHAHLPCICY